MSALGVGAGITTTLISLIANAGPENQAVATAGELVAYAAYDYTLLLSLYF